MKNTEFFKLGKYQIPKENLYMMFIERGNGYIRGKDKDGFFTRELYHEKLFDNEKGYSKAMTEAFEFLNEELEKKTELSEQLIKGFHNRAMSDVKLLDETISKFLEPGNYRKYNVRFGFLPHSISVEFFNKIKKEPYFKIDGKQVGQYIFPRVSKREEDMKFLTEKESVELHLNSPEISGDNSDIYFSEKIQKLIEDYQENISAGGKTDDNFKLRAIGDFLHNIESLHSFPDGNGRTNQFLLLNYLLLQQDLTPCSFYNTWHTAGFTSDQRIKAIEEGQEFFEKYILSENTTQNIPSAPLTKGLEKIIENSKSASRKETAFFNLLDEVTSGLPLDEETLNLEENHAEKVRIYANNVLSLKYELTDSDWDELCLVTLCAHEEIKEILKTTFPELGSRLASGKHLGYFDDEPEKISPKGSDDNSYNLLNQNEYNKNYKIEEKLSLNKIEISPEITNRIFVEPMNNEKEDKININLNSPNSSSKLPKHKQLVTKNTEKNKL